MNTYSKIVVATMVAALFAVAAFSVQAGDKVKAGGPSDRPARSLDAESAKSQGPSSKPGRSLDDMSVRSQGASNKPGRAFDEVVKTSKAKKAHSRAADQASK